jgi:hypothetical protein
MYVSVRCAADVKDSRDDEYRWAGVEDPKVVVTTSRDPSSRLKQFAKVGRTRVKRRERAREKREKEREETEEREEYRWGPQGGRHDLARPKQPH